VLGLEEKAITEKIKRIRLNKNITLKALANKTGLTEGYLSRIENSENAPPISTLSRIAQGLEIDLSFLFLPGNKAADENPNIVIVQKKEVEEGDKGTPHGRTLYGYHFEPLASKKRGKNMQPYILVPDFEPGESLQHEGEEFLYVLEGSIEFFYGAEKFRLTKGDCAYFESHIPHNGRSVGEEKARVLIILHSYKRL
jgi:transcriptional regulator with XRE-family HTH domain